MFLFVVSFSTESVSYRPPRSVIVTSTKLQQGIEFYYIGATNGATRLFGPQALDVGDSSNTLAASINQVPTEGLFLILIADNIVRDETRVDFNLTVIGKLLLFYSFEWLPFIVTANCWFVP